MAPKSRRADLSRSASALDRMYLHGGAPAACERSRLLIVAASLEAVGEALRAGSVVRRGGMAYMLTSATHEIRQAARHVNSAAVALGGMHIELGD
jgi:hypothetical protein